MGHEATDMYQYAQAFLRTQRDFLEQLDQSNGEPLSARKMKELLDRLQDISEVIGMLTLALQRSFDPELVSFSDQLVAIRKALAHRLQ